MKIYKLFLSSGSNATQSVIGYFNTEEYAIKYGKSLFRCQSGSDCLLRVEEIEVMVEEEKDISIAYNVTAATNIAKLMKQAAEKSRKKRQKQIRSKEFKQEFIDKVTQKE